MKYIVTYTDTDGGINTTEQQIFSIRYEASKFYNQKIKEGTPDVYLCEVIIEGEAKSVDENDEFPE